MATVEILFWHLTFVPFDVPAICFILVILDAKYFLDLCDMFYINARKVHCLKGRRRMSFLQCTFRPFFNHSKQKKEIIIYGDEWIFFDSRDKGNAAKVKRHNCAHCTKTFFRLDRLKQHIRSHTVEKRYLLSVNVFNVDCKAMKVMLFITTVLKLFPVTVWYVKY